MNKHIHGRGSLTGSTIEMLASRMGLLTKDAPNHHAIECNPDQSEQIK
ncbi:hypothetical protein ACW9HW_00405 [Pseudomonas sp. SDO5532_S415]